VASDPGGGPPSKRRSSRERAADIRPEDVMRSSRERAADIRPEDVMRSSRERAADTRPEDVMRSSRERQDGSVVLRGRRSMGAARRMRAAADSRVIEGRPDDGGGAWPDSLSAPAVEPPAPPPLSQAPAPAPAVFLPRVERVPWESIVALARRYDPLQITGGLDRAIALSDSVRREFAARGGFSVAPLLLAACLAFECRSMQHCGIIPQGDDLMYLCALHAAVVSASP